jgi:multimeric flavodoxin WrbA
MADFGSSKTLLVVWHSRTGASEGMACAAAIDAAAQLVRAEDVTPTAILSADGYLFVCPENLGSMSGAMKEMFDRTYYPVLGQIEGRPYASIIAAGSDGQGAQRQLDRIVTGWRLRRAAPALIFNFSAQTPETILATKEVPVNILKQCRELGEAMVQGMELGVF